MKKLKLLIPIVLITSTILPNLKFFIHQNEYKLHFVDIGQGDSILLRTPTNCVMAIDGGLPNKLTDRIANYLPATENQIDLLVITHPDLDHIGGAVQLLKRYKVKNVFLTGVHHSSATYKELLNQIELNNSKIHYVTSNDNFNLCGIQIEVLYPIKTLVGQEVPNLNDTSITLRLKIKDQYIFLSGDLEESEHELTKSNKDLKSDIMKAGHHGSRTSNSLELLEKIQPKYFVIQSGADNSYGHPHPEILQRLKQFSTEILRNDKRGTITFFF